MTLGPLRRRGATWYSIPRADGDGRGSFLLGAICCIQGSHVSCSRDEVDDTNDGLEQRDGSCDPEAHPEKPHRANYGEADRKKESRGWRGARQRPLSPPPRQGRVEPSFPT